MFFIAIFCFRQIRLLERQYYGNVDGEINSTAIIDFLDVPITKNEFSKMVLYLYLAFIIVLISMTVNIMMTEGNLRVRQQKNET